MNGPRHRLAGRRWPARSRSGLDLPVRLRARVGSWSLRFPSPASRRSGPRGPRHGWSGSRSRAATTRSSARCGRAAAGSADAAATRQPTPTVTPAAPPAPAPTPATATARRRRSRSRQRSVCSSARCRGAARAAAPIRRRATLRATDRCAEERRLADERCELATRARAQADAAVDALRARPAELRRARSGGGHGVVESGPARRPRGQGRGPGRLPMPRSRPRPVRTSSRRPPGTG